MNVKLLRSLIPLLSPNEGKMISNRLLIYSHATLTIFISGRISVNTIQRVSSSSSRKNRKSGHTRGINPIPGRCAFFTSDNDSGTFLLPGFDVAPNTVVLRFGDLETGGQTQTETKVQ